MRKRQQRAEEEATAAVNRLAHGTPKHVKKMGKQEKQRVARKIDAHKLDPEGRR